MGGGRQGQGQGLAIAGVAGGGGHFGKARVSGHCGCDGGDGRAAWAKHAYLVVGGSTDIRLLGQSTRMAVGPLGQSTRIRPLGDRLDVAVGYRATAGRVGTHIRGWRYEKDRITRKGHSGRKGGGKRTEQRRRCKGHVSTEDRKQDSTGGHERRAIDKKG